MDRIIERALRARPLHFLCVEELEQQKGDVDRDEVDGIMKEDGESPPGFKPKRPA